MFPAGQMPPHPPPAGLFSLPRRTGMLSNGLLSDYSVSRVFAYASTQVRSSNHSRSKTSTSSLNSRSSSSRAIFTFWWVSLRT